MSIQDRLRKLEEQQVSERIICPECGQEAQPYFGIEMHHEDGVVVRDHRTCEGCDRLSGKLAEKRGGGIPVTTICPVGCWCEGDWYKADAAPRVYLDELDDQDFERYADGAAKYTRKMREMGL
jgi:hypothetical protein